MSAISPYVTAGAKLIERGYSAIPIAPGTKRPGYTVNGEPRGMNDWARFCDRAPTNIEAEFWASLADTAIGIALGYNDIVAVDIDTNDKAIIAAIGSCLPYTPSIKRGQKGETRFFRGKAAPRSYNIGGRRVCDLLGYGRQSVLPPSLHPDTGQPYRWTGEKALEDLHYYELPELPDNVADLITEALKPFGYRPEDCPGAGTFHDHGDGDSPFSQLNSAALANLDAWVPRLGLARCKRVGGKYVAVAEWRASNTGRPFEQRKMSLSIHPDGIRDFGDDKSYTPINLVMAACGLGDDKERAFMMLSNWLGRGETVFDGELISENEKRNNMILVNGNGHDPDSGEVFEDTAETTETKGNDYADAILARPSLVSDIAKWVLSVSRRPQKRLAVASALAVVGTAASRQFETPTHSNLNLYLLMVAPTGTGKEAPMKAASSIFAKAGLPELIGPDGFGSDVGIYSHMYYNPACLSLMDEFGTFLSAITCRNAQAHSQKIISALRKFYDGGIMRSSNSGCRQSVVLRNPCLSILAASTPRQFFGAVSGDQAEDGFLNRFVAVMVRDDVKKHAPADSVADVPKHITGALLELANRAGGINASRYRLQMVDGDIDLKPKAVAWTSEAQMRWESYEDEIMGRMRRDRNTELFGPRCAHNAIRIATILALSENSESPLVAIEHVELAISIMEASLKDMVAGFHSHTKTTEESERADKLLYRIGESKRGIDHTALYKRVRSSFKTVKQFREAIETLTESGQVTATTMPAVGSGKAKTIYRKV